MLSEARARLANTQGKKAKRKARERQLEESRRLAQLQKRRELKNAGINIKITNRKKGQMDYNADIPFERQAAPGFYDTQEEELRNERQREAFDPRKQQLANKRKGEADEDADRKRRKNDKSGPSAAFAAAAKAGQMQKIREAEQSSKRRALQLPAPQVSESELEDIVKMGIAGERAAKMADEDEDDSTRALVSNYSSIVGNAPIRTPRAPPQEDHIANEIRNIRALTETQSSLLGGENTPLYEGTGSTGFEGVAPRTQQMVTPNPMATPFRQRDANGLGATPIPNTALPGATPLRTPRDNFAINKDGDMQLAGATPRDLKIREHAVRQQLRAKLSSLPKPKETEWELEEPPTENSEPSAPAEIGEEDAAEIDRRNKEAREAAAAAEFKRQTQVVQRSLPRPRIINFDTLKKQAAAVSDPIQRLIAQEMSTLVVSDARKFPIPEAKVEGAAPNLEKFSDELLAKARAAIVAETSLPGLEAYNEEFTASFEDFSPSNPLPGLSDYDEHGLSLAFSDVQSNILSTAEKGNKLEKKLALHLGGYQGRAKTLRAKIVEASEALEKASIGLDTFKTLRIAEDAAIGRRLEELRADVSFVSRREREAQEKYRNAKEELRDLEESVIGVNGFH